MRGVLRSLDPTGLDHSFQQADEDEMPKLAPSENGKSGPGNN
jgi:hypothetical protein